MPKLKEKGAGTCGAVTHNRAIVGVAFRFPPHESACARLSMHRGPHVAKGQGDKFYAFQNMCGCFCSDCRSETPEFHCEDVREVTQEEKSQLLADKNYTIEL
jgi:hypothetical protein